MSPRSADEPGDHVPGVRLIGARPEHAALCWEWRHEPHARRYNPFDDLTPGELAVRLGAVGHDLSQQVYRTFRWMVEADGLGLVGTVSICANWRMRHGELGYQIGSACSGKGLAGAAVAAVVAHAFQDSELERLFATVSVGNVASRRVVEKLGFAHEGTLRRHHRIEGRFVDQWVFGLLREEWLTLRSRTEP